MKKNRIISAILVIVLTIGCFSVSTTMTDAASQKRIKSVKISIGGQKVNGKAYYVQKGKTVKLKVSVSPSKAKKSTSYKSSKKSVASISKGKIKAKKTGTAKITVRVKGKNGKYKSTWVKIEVVSYKVGNPLTGGKYTSGSGDASNSGQYGESISGGSASCSHAWDEGTLIRADNQQMVAVSSPTNYDVCGRCGYVKSRTVDESEYSEIEKESRDHYCDNDIEHHKGTGSNWWTDIPIGISLTHYEGDHTMEYNCKKCGATKTVKFHYSDQGNIEFSHIMNNMYPEFRGTGEDYSSPISVEDAYKRYDKNKCSHDWTLYRYSGVETNDGLKNYEYICKKCMKFKVIIIRDTSLCFHSYLYDHMDEEGHRYLKCGRCGDERLFYEEKTKNCCDHNFDVIKENSDGTVTYKCSKCNAEVAAPDHVTENVFASGEF